MPNYLFVCSTCKIKFEELCRWDDRVNVACPKCSGKPEQLLTAPSAILFTNPKGTSKEDNFEYVAAKNYENAQNFRRAAEAQNTHGYGYEELDDISKYEGKFADIDPFEK